MPSIHSVSLKMQATESDGKPPSRSTSFPKSAFGRSTPLYSAFLEALLDGLMEYEVGKEGYVNASEPLPAA